MVLSIKEIINSVIRGDTFDVLSDFPEHCIDLIVADMPYNKTLCKWETKIDLKLLWKLYKRILKNNGVVCLFCEEPLTSFITISNIEEFRYKWIWDKQFGANFAQVKSRPLNTYEEIVVFSNGQNIYNPQMIERTSERVQQAHDSNYVYMTKSEHSLSSFAKKQDKPSYRKDFKKYSPNEKYPELIIKHIPQIRPNSTEKVAHSTQKPESLYEWFINHYTYPNMVVLDNFSGSGTNAIASLKTNRKFICIEKDRDDENKSLGYVQITLERIKNLSTSYSFKKTSFPLYNIYQIQDFFNKFK
jgi:site-specific DNA-methyltransferase (adenine-specific)